MDIYTLTSESEHHNDDGYTIHYFQQRNPETLECWRTGVVIFEIGHVLLASATGRIECASLIALAIANHMEIEQARDRARLARWNNEEEKTK